MMGQSIKSSNVQSLNGSPAFFIQAKTAEETFHKPAIPFLALFLVLVFLSLLFVTVC